MLQNNSLLEKNLIDSGVSNTQRTNFLKNNQSDATNKSYNVFGDDGITFLDLIDIINPLQHIPVISTLYRNITGDKIDPASKLAGAALYGGPLGAIASAFNLVVEFNTGKDIGEHVINENKYSTEASENTTKFNTAKTAAVRSLTKTKPPNSENSFFNLELTPKLDVKTDNVYMLQKILLNQFEAEMESKGHLQTKLAANAYRNSMSLNA